jgi:hypothetical protein
MATTVASRFSVLSLDVDDDVGRGRKQKKTPLGDSSNSVKDKSSSKSGGSAQSKQQDAKKKNTKKKGDTNNVSLVSSAKYLYILKVLVDFWSSSNSQIYHRGSRMAPKRRALFPLVSNRRRHLILVARKAKFNGKSGKRRTKKYYNFVD